MYSNYCRHSLLCTKIFCVRACVCVLRWSMSINVVQCSLHKLKTNGQQTPQQSTKNSQKLLLIVFFFSNNLQRERIGLWFPAVIQQGFCHMVLITFHYPRNNPRIKKASLFRPTHKWHCPREYRLSDCHCTRLRRKTPPGSRSKPQQNGHLCIFFWYVASLLLCESFLL